MKTPYAQKTAKRSTSSGVFDKRYAHLDPANYNLGGSYQSYATSTSGSSSSNAGTFLDFLSTGTNGLFSYLGDKQTTQQTLSNNNAQQGLSAEETKRTRIVVLGIVAVLLVIGAIALLKRK